MLTPRFVLNQTDNDIIITVHAPYANVSETEIYVHENDVRFHSSPYYLRLNLPGSVEENDGSRASYDADSGDFVIRLGKTNDGQHFPDLDMITRLLAPKLSTGSGSKCIVSPNISIVGNDTDDAIENDSDNEWFVEQVPMAEDDPDIRNQIAYGFANSKHSVFKKIESEIPKLVDLPEPDVTPEREREKLRVEDELISFNEGHYLADLEDTHDKDSALYSVLAYKGQWEKQAAAFASLSESNYDVLKDLPNKEYLMDEKEKISSYLGIVDLVFAYAYDQRTTEGEGTVESGWTMAKLSPMLSWLQTFNSLDSLVLSCLRRSLCYPLYRHWELSLKVLNDTRCILQMGKTSILKCLLHMLAIFNANEPQYILNQLYVQDYCIWIQKASTKRIKSLAEALNKFSPNKKDIGLALEELELMVLEALKEESPSKIKYPEKNILSIEHCLANMTIGKVLDEALSDSDDSTSSDDNTSSEISSSSSEETDNDSSSSGPGDNSD